MGTGSDCVNDPFETGLQHVRRSYRCHMVYPIKAIKHRNGSMFVIYHPTTHFQCFECFHRRHHHHHMVLKVVSSSNGHYPHTENLVHDISSPTWVCVPECWYVTKAKKATCKRHFRVSSLFRRS